MRSVHSAESLGCCTSSVQQEAIELLRSRPSRKNVTSYLLHELLHNRFLEPSETHQNDFEAPILHNNIRKVGSFRNRQVASSTLALGSISSRIHSMVRTPAAYWRDRVEMGVGGRKVVSRFVRRQRLWDGPVLTRLK